MKKTTLMSAFIISLMGLTIGATSFFCWQSGSRNKVELDKRQETPWHRVQITGFQFDGHKGEKRVITIKADRFTIERGKIGHLSFGLMNVAKLKNGIIHLYGNSAAKASSSEKVLEPKPEEVGEKRTDRKLELSDVFHDEAMPSFGVKRVSSITLEPIQLILHDEQSVVSEISAAYATIRIKERDIFFKGSVRVVSGQTTLLTETLSLDPLKGIIRSEDQVFVHAATGAKENKGIVTDLFLSEVGPSSGRL
jgi:hypothetical protein